MNTSWLGRNLLNSISNFFPLLICNDGGRVAFSASVLLDGAGELKSVQLMFLTTE